jgi:hypothetical protein
MKDWEVNGKTHPEGLMTASEVKDRLRCSLANVYNLIDMKELACYHVGAGKSGIRVSEKHLQDFLVSRETKKGGDDDLPPLKHISLE